MTLAEKRNAEKNKLLLGLIAKQEIIYNYSKKEIAAKLSMSLATYYNRLNNPDTFKRKELHRLFEFLHFTPEEQFSVI